MSYKIIHKNNKNFLFASGFYSLERAEKWVENFNPYLWMDKTLTKNDLLIVEEKMKNEIELKFKVGEEVIVTQRSLDFYASKCKVISNGPTDKFDYLIENLHNGDRYLVKTSEISKISKGMF